MSTLKIKKLEKLKSDLINPPRPKTTFTIILDAELHKTFKIKAAQEGKTLSDLTRDWIADYCKG